MTSCRKLGLASAVAATIVVSPAWGVQSQSLVSRPAGPLRIDRTAAPPGVDGAGTFLVPEKPACTITLNGNDTDWTACGSPNPQTFTLGSGNPTATVRMYLTHATPPNKDLLHVYFAVSDASSNPGGDLIILMLDTGHTHTDKTDDRGLCFRRNFTVQLISNSPTAACTPNAFPGLDNSTQLSSCSGGRGCIVSVAGQWTVEADLVPADFGLTSFGATVGMIVRAVDGNGATSFNVGPNVSSASDPDPNDPATWANLTLGHALDVALVLDLSGSMAIPACTGCDTRLAFLKLAVQRFIQDFSAFAWQADRISVIRFQTNVTEVPTPGTLVNFYDNKAAILASLPGMMPANLTAMGGGLQTAINRFADPVSQNPGRSRHVVLFSDGMQNVNPMVFDDGAGNWHIDDKPGRPASGVMVASPPTLLNGAPYKVHTLGIDATDGFLTDMNSIAAVTGGTPENRVDATETPALFVNAAITAMQAHGSPQLVDLRRNTMAGDSASEVFTVNRGVRRVLLETIWQGQREIALRVFKDGKDVTAEMHPISSASYRGFFVDPPFQLGADEISAEGQWELRILAPAGTKYEAAALVDEPALKFEVGTGKADYLIGEPLQLVAEITYGGAPVDDATVTARVGKPGEGIGTLLSVNATPPGAPSVTPEALATPAQIKLQRLLEDDKLRQRIQQVEHTVVLESQGAGKYTGSFGATDATGAYSVTFLIAGTTPLLGTYRRLRTVSTVVRFRAGDPDASQFRVRTLGQTASERRVLLSFRPRNGKVFLGPDFGPKIRVMLSKGSAVAEPRDLLDGSYEVELLLPANVDPDITVTVAGQPLFKGKVSELEPRPFALSLHAGVSIPHGALNNTHNPGFGITADAEYWWKPRLAVAALLGYHRFNGQGANPDLDLVHVSAALEARVTTGQPSVIVDAGAGIYNLSPGPTDPGVHGGAGFEFDLSPTVSLGFTARVHTVFTSGSNTTFSSLQAGGRIRF